jgi:hypothetical protein
LGIEENHMRPIIIRGSGKPRFFKQSRIGHWPRLVLVALTILAAAPSVRAKQQAFQNGNDNATSEPCGMFSDLYVRSVPSPTHNRTAIRIMPSRDNDLAEAMEGYRRTGIALVGYGADGLAPAGLSDDLGIYYFIPLLARMFHLDLAQSISVFFLTALIVAPLIASWGLMVVLRSVSARAFALAVLCLLTYLAYRIGDVYVFEFCIPVALMPWIVLLARKRRLSLAAGLGFIVTGFVIGTGATIRSAAAIPIFLFLITLVAAQTKSTRSLRLYFAGLAVAGLLLPLFFFRHIEQKRDDFLVSRAAVDRADLSRHAVWHLAYIGLGFINNPYVSGGFCDDVAKHKVQSMAPGAIYLSSRYDQVLQKEVLTILRTNPLFVLFTIAAKLGIVFMVIVIFANVGLCAALLRPNLSRLEIASWVALFASALPVLIVAPATQYIVGLASMSALYGIFSLDQALDRTAAKSRGVEHGSTLELNALKRPTDELVALPN